LTPIEDKTEKRQANGITKVNNLKKKMNNNEHEYTC
jgi:hypothetical protein